MSRLIDADLIQYELMLSAKGDGMYEDVMVAYKSQIDDLPTIEERKIGKWIETEEQVGWETERFCECSNCGLSFPLDDWTIDEIREEMHYCYQCGARMDESSPMESINAPVMPKGQTRG